MFQFFRTPNIDFMGRRGVGYVISGLMVLAALGTIGMHWSKTGDPLNYGIDFRGGSQFQVRFVDKPPDEALRATLQAAGFDPSLQAFSGDEADSVLIRVADDLEKDPDLVGKIRRALRSPAETEKVEAGLVDLNTAGEDELARLLEREITGREPTSIDPIYSEAAAALLTARGSQPTGMFADLGAATAGLDESVSGVIESKTFVGTLLFERTESVGPVVGQDLRAKALRASLIANLLILLYLSVRFELRFGVAAVITLVHDLIIIVGIFALTDREFDLTVLAAILTVIGYSVNDTIVVFDRIRYNLKIARRDGLLDVINASINQTLSRTVLTSGSTLLVVVPLYIYGGAVLNNFAFALLLGIVVGTYSSIFVASPILWLWQRFVAKKA